MDRGSQQERPPEFLKGGWFFSVIGTLIAIPVGIRQKSLAPLVFFSSTGAMLDIILATQYYEWQKEEQDKLARDSAQKASQGDELRQVDVILRDDFPTEELK